MLDWLKPAGMQMKAESIHLTQNAVAFVKNRTALAMLVFTLDL
jgi:hypothetical protein